MLEGMIVNACKWRKALPEDFDSKMGRYNEEGRHNGETQGNPKGKKHNGKIIQNEKYHFYKF